MKHFILTLSTLLIVNFAFSQNYLEQKSVKNPYPFQDFVQYFSEFKKANQLPKTLKSVYAYTEKLVNVVTTADEGSKVKMDFTYENNHVTGSTNYMYEPASENWIGLTRTTFSYNDDGNILQELTVYINPAMAGLGNDVKIDYEYNAEGQLKQTVISNKTAGSDAWVVSSRSEYTYNEQGLLMQEINYTADFITGQLVLAGKFDMVYTAEGILKEELMSVANPITGSFEPDSKSEYTFNEEGYLVVQIDYEKNIQGTMEYSNKTENTFDEFGCIKETNSFEYDLNGKKWMAKSRNISVYDHAVVADQLLIPDHFRGMFKYKLIRWETYTWEAAGNTWKNVQNSVYNYADINATGIVENINPVELILYPNPAEDVLFISNIENYGRLEVFNMKGETVITRNIKNKERISVIHLNPGLFFYKIKSDGKVFTGKFLKE